MTILSMAGCGNDGSPGTGKNTTQSVGDVLNEQMKQSEQPLSAEEAFHIYISIRNLNGL